MREEFAQKEVLETLDKLIARNADVLEDEEQELQQVRSNLLALTVKEHVIGELTQEERQRYETVLSKFGELRTRVDSQRAALAKLRAAREGWEHGLPASVQDRFHDLLSDRHS